MKIKVTTLVMLSAVSLVIWGIYDELKYGSPPSPYNIQLKGNLGAAMKPVERAQHVLCPISKNWRIYGCRSDPSAHYR